MNTILSSNSSSEKYQKPDFSKASRRKQSVINYKILNAKGWENANMR
jgi:hypothetical protein